MSVRDERTRSGRRKRPSSTAGVQAGNRTVAGAMTHAWLFTGPPGSGRSVAARAFAAALLCPYGGCGGVPPPALRAAARCGAGTHADLLLVRPDGLSYGVKQTRDLVLRGGRARRRAGAGAWCCSKTPTGAPRPAANALLKAIEEPAPRTVWLPVRAVRRGPR